MTRGDAGTNGPVLVRQARAEPAPRVWDDAAREVLDGAPGFLRVLGGPGTGKTSLLAETAARRIADGVDAERVLVLTHSRQAADAVRSEITHLLCAGTGGGNAGALYTMREPLVRTVHSYAFGVLRALASRDGTPPPRLLSGPEQDAVVRDLLAGDLERGAEYWPERLRPALSVPGFAEELRDLLLRAAERGLGPEDLTRLGRREKHEEWIAAGAFWKQYEQVTLLQGAGGSALAVPGSLALDAAELVTSALLALTDDDDLLARERARIRHLLVDDAQHLDPMQYRLLRLIGTGAGQFVLAGDPDQSVFSFRGADPRVLADAEEHGARTVVLPASHRLAPAVHAGVAPIVRSFSGVSAHRAPATEVPPDELDAVRVRLFATPSAEASWVADQLRRAHLLDGLAWRDMAVIARSPRAFGVLQRALRASGVPIASAAGDLPLARNPAVSPLLTALRVVSTPETLDPFVAETLLASPLGGADPLALRRLRRGLRRIEQAGGGSRSSDELMVTALRTGEIPAGLADSEAAALKRLSSVLATGRTAMHEGHDVEHVLWQLWQASGLQQRWARLAERGGSLGRQADADLDAIVALFHAAGQYVDRLPFAGVAGFADYLFSQRIVGDSLAPTAAVGDGVELLTAHSAAGREWTLVAIIGVQEGSWPDLRPRGSLLGVERLVDLLAGVDANGVSAIAPLLAEERRLFYVAASRARRRLLVSAVSGEDEQPSRFVEELHAEQSGDEDVPLRLRPEQRPLVLSTLVGELRSAVCDPGGDPDRRARAARSLAKLAAAGVPGAHPRSWYGLPEVSSDAPLRAPGEVITVSPSTVELLDKCALRWLIERNGGTDPAPLAAVAGTVIHALAQAAAAGAPEDRLRDALEGTWAQIDVGAPWFKRSEHQRLRRMVDAFLIWLRSSRGELTEVGVEDKIEIDLPADEGEPTVRLTGRVDRLERDRDGRVVIVDLKTGKTAISGADAREHPQLAAYQLAVSLGAANAGTEPGGGRLVFLADQYKSGAPKERVQDALDEVARKEWLDRVRAAATSGLGPDYTAQASSDCDRCPARGCCPLRPEGRQVTS